MERKIKTKIETLFWEKKIERLEVKERTEYRKEEKKKKRKKGRRKIKIKAINLLKRDRRE